MSHDHALEFINKLRNSKSFRDEIFGIEGFDERMNYIVKKGFHVTKEEIELAFEDFKHKDPEIRRKEVLFGVSDDILQLLKYVLDPYSY